VLQSQKLITLGTGWLLALVLLRGDQVGSEVRVPAANIALIAAYFRQKRYNGGEMWVFEVTGKKFGRRALLFVLGTVSAFSMFLVLGDEVSRALYGKYMPDTPAAWSIGIAFAFSSGLLTVLADSPSGFRPFGVPEYRERPSVPKDGRLSWNLAPEKKDAFEREATHAHDEVARYVRFGITATLLLVAIASAASLTLSAREASEPRAGRASRGTEPSAAVVRDNVIAKFTAYADSIRTELQQATPAIDSQLSTLDSSAWDALGTVDDREALFRRRVSLQDSSSSTWRDVSGARAGMREIDTGIAQVTGVSVSDVQKAFTRLSKVRYTPGTARKLAKIAGSTKGVSVTERLIGITVRDSVSSYRIARRLFNLPH
jgi:hypothetical protein